MCPVRYVSMIRSKDHRFDYRKALVASALDIGVKPTVRAFGTTTKTVRKWRDRYLKEGSAGLRDRSRRPHTCPHQTSAANEAVVLAQRRQAPGCGAKRLKMEFELSPSVGAIGRILRQHGLTRKPRKKYHRISRMTQHIRGQAAFRGRSSGWPGA